VLRVEHLSKSYDKPLFQDLSFDILRGQRWGIMGSNGTGKTTLLRCVLGRESVDNGNAILGTGVVVGYFDQMLATLPDDLPAVEAVRPPGKEFNEQQRRDMLARFGIRSDMVFQPIRQLSGGERNRVVLAKLAASDVNFLVLDEPTNHLDLWARDALEQSLRAYSGTLLCVSHDRFFLNQVADHLLVMRPDGHQLILGNFDTYLRGKLPASATHHAHHSTATSASATGEIAKPEQRDEKGSGSGKPRRKRRFPYRKIEEIEGEIFEKESEIELLQARLGAPEVLRDGAQIKQIQQRMDAVRAELQPLYEHWEEATELN
jgi:ATP-binding cassette, subfamily F, member 3